MPPPRFELQISRLPGKGAYSTRPPGTTSSLMIWVDVCVASVTNFPPTERGVNSPDRKGGEGAPPGEEEGAGRRGESLVVVVVTSGTGEAKAA